MPRRRVNYEDFRIEWDSANRKMRIIPRNPNASVTPNFGLGNATIRFNVSNPPQKIVKPITGDSDASGLLPYTPFDLRAWKVAVSNVSKKVKQLPKTNLNSETTYYPIEYPFANSYFGEELRNDVDVKKNSVGNWRKNLFLGRIS